MNTTLTSVPIKRFYPVIRRMLRSQLTGYAEWRMLQKELVLLLEEHKGFYVTAFTDVNNANRRELLPFLGNIIVNNISEEDIINTIEYKYPHKFTSMDVDSFIWQTKFVIIYKTVFQLTAGGNSVPDDREADAMRVCFERLGKLGNLDAEKIMRQANPLDKHFTGQTLYDLSSKETKAKYRRVAAEIAIATGKNETDIPLSRINSTYRHIFPPVSVGTYKAMLLCATVFLTFCSLCFIYAVYPKMGTKMFSGAAVCVVAVSYAFVKPLCDMVCIRFTKHLSPPSRLELKGKVPKESKVLCVLSTLLVSEKDLENGIKRLHAASVKNSGKNISFCLLCDLKPAKTAELPQDRQLIAAAQTAFSKFAENGNFSVIIRNRVYSKTQRMYQGYERKRGAIENLCMCLRNSEFGNVHVFGDRETLRDVKYIAALDYDTTPLMDSISELVGVLMHPDNAGLGIAVPRMTTTLKSALETHFSRITAGAGGSCSAGSYDNFAGEFYYDSFGEGTFTGKGLIDVDIFIEKAVRSDVFKPEKILSHDVLEGGLCGVAYSGDIEFSDKCPDTSLAFFKRQNRWLRGDFQNFGFAFDRRFSPLTRFKLFDNVLRGIIPIFTFVAVILGVVTDCVFLTAAACVSLLTPYLLSLFPSLFGRGKGGGLMQSLRFSMVTPMTATLLKQCVTALCLLPKNALVALDALLRTVWRRVFTHRHLLDWQTASAFEHEGQSSLHMLPSFAVSIALVFSYCYFRCTSVFNFAVCLFFVVAMPVMRYCDCPGNISSVGKPSEKVRRALTADAAKIWAFYSDFVTETYNHLPPDNVQYSPVYRVAERTSPTNIGMYLLSCMAARKLEFITESDFTERIDSTLSAVEKLDKWHGNLLNWYDIVSLKPISNFVSSVDSGNFVCCLVTLKQYLTTMKCDETLAARVKKLIDETELRPFFRETKNLFSIGVELERSQSSKIGTSWEMSEGKLSVHNYDLIMSEARLLSYFAIGSGQVDKTHWRALQRVMGCHGKNYGPVAWTGTMFEFLMPELLLCCREGSLGHGALLFALKCQYERGAAAELPFGISESGYYSFDDSLNYQYKAHGVPDAALAAGLEKDYVVSPYSTYLAMPLDYITCCDNLSALRTLDAYHSRYGFYEAVDFTPLRVGRGIGKVPSHAVVKSHMAHHMGMSMAGIANTLFVNSVGERFFQQLFLSDENMKRAEELLEERPITGTQILNEPMKKFEKRPNTRATEYSDHEVFEAFDENNPRVNPLSNGSVTVLTSDIGVCNTVYVGDGIQMWINSGGRLPSERKALGRIRPHGALFAFADDTGGFVPFINMSMTHTRRKCSRKVTFSQNSTQYNIEYNSISLSMSVYLHSEKPVEFRKFSVQNKGKSKRQLTLAALFEPQLASNRDYSAHPSFMDLFVDVHVNDSRNLFIITRRERGGDGTVCVAAGFFEHEDLTFSFDRESLTERGNGSLSVFRKAMERDDNEKHIPAPCLFIKADFPVDAGMKREANMFICYGKSEREVTAIAECLRAEKVPLPSSEIISSLVSGTIYGKLTKRVLPAIMFDNCRTERVAEILRNNLPKRELWKFGISGDLPIVLFSFSDNSERMNKKALSDSFSVSSAIEMKKALTLCGIKFDLVILASDRIAGALGETGGKHRELCEKLASELHTQVFIISDVDERMCNLLKSVAVYTIGGEVKNAANRAVSKQSSRRIFIHRTNPQVSSQKSAAPQSGFDGEKYVCMPNAMVNNPPWSNIIAAQNFGTLLSDRSLGYTWAGNSRENKITPWENDLCEDNSGERVIIKSGGRYVDACDGAVAVFAPNKADYYGESDDIRSNVSVRVFERGYGKRVNVTLVNMSDTQKNVSALYFITPILGVSADDSGCVRTAAAEFHGTRGVVCENPDNCEFSGVAALNVRVLETDELRSDLAFFTDSVKLGAGDWFAELPNLRDIDMHDIAACAVRTVLQPGGSITVQYYLTFTRNKAEPYSMFTALANSERIVSSASAELTRKDCFSPKLALLYSHWLPFQTVSCRMFARTGHYQCSGAYGFRDQLQDAMAAVYVSPQVAAAQILRCCTAQFQEGDVLHWWHAVNNADVNAVNSGNKRGVRTRYSDDLLWLPYALALYCDIKCDIHITDVNVAYATGDMLKANEHEKYMQIHSSCVRESVYVHAKKTLEYAFQKGAHGLLLMRGGDWCDGYNKVGHGGKGESVWLSMFYVRVAKDFSRLARKKSDIDFSDELMARAYELTDAINDTAWNGDYYVRAYYDDGNILGTKDCEHCRIDLLPQVWASMAELWETKDGVNRVYRERCELAVESAQKYLCDKRFRLVKLFTPAFAPEQNRRTGYVTDYPAGVRENGGQYTHAAVWLIHAYIALEDYKSALEIAEMLAPFDRDPDIYKTEPYFLAADIYTNPSCYGRGGWSIYTGSAGWYFTALRKLLQSNSGNPEGNADKEVVASVVSAVYELVNR